MIHSDARFAHAVQVVLHHEGGLSHHPADGGGLTRFGISAARYPHLSIATLSREHAIQLYYDDWWLAYGYERILSLTIATKVFDAAVTMGGKAAHRCLQRALRAAGVRIAEDGVLGEQTINAVNAVDPAVLLAAYRSELGAYYRLIVQRRPDQKVFINGWLRRAYS